MRPYPDAYVSLNDEGLNVETYCPPGLCKFARCLEEPPDPTDRCFHEKVGGACASGLGRAAVLQAIRRKCRDIIRRLETPEEEEA